MNKNYLLSHPRSGNSFFRYCVEKITEQPTMGCKDGDPNKDGPMYLRKNANIVISNTIPILYKEHFWENIPISEITNIILIIRNPANSFHSHALRGRQSRQNVEKYGLIFSEALMENLEQFDAYNGNKIVFYYEDLLNNIKLKNILQKSLNFLNCSSENIIENLNKLILNIDNIREESMNTYHAGKIVKPILDKKIPEKWMINLKSLNSEIYDEYLKIYEL